MPRPCQQRRASAAANRKSKPSKPAGPPPIRHKAKQKAIHNARRGRGGQGGRGGGRGGARGGYSGGRFSQNNAGRASKNRQSDRNDLAQDFIPLSSGGNDFNALYRASRDDEMDGSLEEGELSSDSGTDSDNLDDEDMHDADDIAINVQATLPLTGRSRPARAQVMFTVMAAVDIFEAMRRSNYALSLPTGRTRYGLFQEDPSPDSGTYIFSAPAPASRRLSVNSATSEEAITAPGVRAPPKATAAQKASVRSEALTPQPETYNPARDYVFDWGPRSGKRFADIHADSTDRYLKTIGGQLYMYTDKHPGLKEAFEYFMPGKARLAPPAQPQGQSSQHQPKQMQSRPSQAGPSRSQPPPPAPRGARNLSSNGASSGPSRSPPSGPSSGPSPSDTWKFQKGMYQGMRLYEVPLSYIKSMENNPKVRESWPGFAEAVRDFREKLLV